MRTLRAATGLLLLGCVPTTGPGNPVRGQLLRLKPIQWQQVDTRFQ